MFGIFVFVQLAMVIAVHKQLDGTFKRLRTSRKASGPPHQPGQIMAEFCVHTFNRKGIRFSFRDTQFLRVINQGWIKRKFITVILFGFGAFINQCLKTDFISLPEYPPPHHTASFSLYCCDDVDALFLVSMKVKSSSNSIVCRSSGGGVSGNWAAKALTQLITVVW